MVWWLLCPAALAASVFATCGTVGLGLLVGQAAVGVMLLEVINYVEVRMFLRNASTRLGVTDSGGAPAWQLGQ